MKKILLGLFALLTVALTSCKEEAGLPEPGTPVDAATQVAGTYVGTWSYYSTSKPDNIIEHDGSLTLSKRGDENYVINVVANCPTFEATPLDKNNPWPLTAPANVTPAKVFFNAVKTAFGNEFNGVIKEDKNVTMTFAQTIKEGRKQYVYYFTFTGVKQ